MRLLEILAAAMRARPACEERPSAEAGQGLVEYALILLFVASAVVLQLTFFGGRVQELYTTIVNGLPF